MVRTSAALCGSPAPGCETETQSAALPALMANPGKRKLRIRLKASTVYYLVHDMTKPFDSIPVLSLPLKMRFGDAWAEVDAGAITIGLHPAEGHRQAQQGGGGTV